jgi:hypothetical protein
MAFSATYIAIEAMLQQGWVMMNLFEFEKLLGLLVEKGMISGSEQNALLELAGDLNLNQLPRPWLRE